MTKNGALAYRSVGRFLHHRAWVTWLPSVCRHPSTKHLTTADIIVHDKGQGCCRYRGRSPLAGFELLRFVDDLAPVENEVDTVPLCVSTMTNEIQSKGEKEGTRNDIFQQTFVHAP